ncbi:hypothetical protein PTKIN_Ptkin12aG0034900 [Pterospermum kingtungense]
MSNLLNHPEAPKKAKDEIDSQIAAPLLVPHMPSNDCNITGYDVPRGAIVLVNAWAIHRDLELWDDPMSFKPERFENDEKSKEYSHKLMPFGFGRRACLGANLAQRMVGLTLGSLIQCFEWEKVDGKEIDMSEGIESTMPKAQPLEAMCKARPIMNKVFNKEI